ncbi:glycosyltransferase [Vibrio sp. DNB22_19_1]
MRDVIDDLVVAIFTYQQEEYIKDAIISIYNQTVWPSKLFIFDDCSKDKTVEFINEVIKKKPDRLNIEVVLNDSNIGLSSQFNKLNGKFNNTLIIVQAGDDISNPERLEKQYAIWKNDSDVKLVLSQFNKINYCGDVVSGRDESELFDFNLNSIIERNILPAGCTAAIDSSLFNDFPPLDENVINEDRIFIFRAYLKGKAVKVMQPLIDYRYDVGISALSQNTREEFINKWQKMYSRELVDLSMNLTDAKCVNRHDVVDIINEKKVLVKLLNDLFYNAFDSKFNAWKEFFSKKVNFKRLFKFNRRVNKYFKNTR